MTPVQLAALVFHEVLWQRVRDNDAGKDDSTHVRYVNAKLWANDFEDISFEEYSEKIAPKILGEKTFYSSNLLVNTRNQVFQGQINTNLGVINPVRILGPIDQLSVKPTLIEVSEGSTICRADNCIDNIRYVLLAADGKIINLIQKYDMMNKTIPAFAYTFNRDGNIDGIFPIAHLHEEIFHEYTYVFGEDARLDQVNDTTFGLLRLLDRSGNLLAYKNNFHFTVGKSDVDTVQFYFTGACATIHKPSQTARIIISQHDPKKDGIYIINRTGVVSKNLIEEKDFPQSCDLKF